MVFNEGELKKFNYQEARKIMLMDSTKFNKDMPFTFATLKDVDILISDQKLPDNILKEAEKYEVTVY